VKKKILFRADGNSEIGLGHVFRCIAIAERIIEDFDCFFAIRLPSQELKDIICRSITLIPLPDYKNYSLEAQAIANDIIPAYKIDGVTLDGYFFDTSYQQILKENCDIVLISIDDDQPFHYISDVVLNHAGHLDSAMISREPYTKLFLGYNYLLLRKEFINRSKPTKHITGINSVLVCFGGADPNNYTARILECLLKNESISRIDVVIGSSYNQIVSLKQTISKRHHVKLSTNLDAVEMAKLMATSDLAIVPSSTIGLEAFVSEMILITGMTAGNQQNIYKGLIKEATVYGIGDFNNISCAGLLKIINDAALKFNDYTFFSQKRNVDPLIELYKSII
jgi:pseudaminic acid biosynthesis-associated protein PseG